MWPKPSARGTLDARLLDGAFAATLAGSLEWIGEILVDEETVFFSTRGAFLGEGRRGLLTLVSEAWLGFTSSGEAIDGRPIELRGLLYLRRKTLLPLRAGEAIVGTYLATVLLEGKVHSLQGAFVGNAAGDLAPSGTPGTLRMVGVGEARIEGAFVEGFGELPEPVEAGLGFLSSEFLTYLDALLGLHASTAAKL